MTGIMIDGKLGWKPARQDARNWTQQKWGGQALALWNEQHATARQQGPGKGDARDAERVTFDFVCVRQMQER